MMSKPKCPNCGGPGVWNWHHTEVWCLDDCHLKGSGAVGAVGVAEAASDGAKPVIDADGTACWLNADGNLHRDGGLPAVEQASGTKQWWVDGKRHRDGGLPAVERASGRKEWWVDGKRHRDGGLPALERASGNREWWVDGKRVK